MKNTIVCLLFACLCFGAAAQQPWISYKGGDGPGKGKRIVLISGDEEYRSEEALPMLAKILSRHGFDCTVLFSIDPASGQVDALNQRNIPGLGQLRNADLMIIFTRFRALPDSQMRYVQQYLLAGKPVIGLRTATHAFNYADKDSSHFANYGWNSKSKGFGKQVLGETWIDHHGVHGKEGTRALVNGILLNEKNPLLNGVADIWVPTDVYAVTDLGKADILLYGQSTSGMTAQAPVNLDKSVMPVAWTREYKVDNGKTGKAFTTTMGASVDLVNEDLRRLIVNACYWATGLAAQIPARSDVHITGEYHPTMFGFDSFKKGRKPIEYK